MDFALFMERYVYRALWYLGIGLIIAIPIAIWYELKSGAFYTQSEATFFIVLFVIVSIIAVKFGGFMGRLRKMVYPWWHYLRK